MHHLKILWSGIWRMLVILFGLILVLGLIAANEAAGLLFILAVLFFALAYGLGVMVHIDDTFHSPHNREKKSE